MSARAEYFFEKLKTEIDLESLKGQPEDLNLDAKEWHAARPKECIAPIVEAACGFANASGGVIAIGLKAKRDPNTGDDVISDLLPFSNPDAVAAQITDMIVQQIEPGISGVVHRTIFSVADSTKGYVIVSVPESNDLHRLRTGHRDFVQRIGSSTLRMEYYQIRDRFGRRPHAQLTVEVGSWDNTSNFTLGGDPLHLRRLFKLAVRNTGRGIAHWPCIFMQRSPGIAIENIPFVGEQTLWPRLDLGDGSFSLRAKAGDIVYPSERIVVATFSQIGVTEPNEFGSFNPALKYATARIPFKWHFPKVTLSLSVACDGMGMTPVALKLPEFKTQTFEPPKMG